MSLSVEYRGYTIRYSENGDVWDSDAFKTFKHSAPTLSKAKEKIDNLLRDVRKQAALQCFELTGGHNAPYGFRESTIIEYEGPKLEGGSWTGKKQYVDTHKVGIVSNRSGTKSARADGYLNTLVHATTEDQMKVDQANRLLSQAKAIEDEAKALIKSIPRVTLDDIQELVRISGIDPTGGLKE